MTENAIEVVWEVTSITRHIHWSKIMCVFHYNIDKIPSSPNFVNLFSNNIVRRTKSRSNRKKMFPPTQNVREEHGEDGLYNHRIIRIDFVNWQSHFYAWHFCVLFIQLQSDVFLPFIKYSRNARGKDLPLQPANINRIKSNVFFTCLAMILLPQFSELNFFIIHIEMVKWWVGECFCSFSTRLDVDVILVIMFRLMWIETAHIRSPSAQTTFTQSILRIVERKLTLPSPDRHDANISLTCTNSGKKKNAK